MAQKLLSPQYDTFYATRTHVHTNGLAMMPTAGEFPLAANVVALNGGMDRQYIAWSAFRRGESPIVPDPVSLNPNYIFLGGSRTGEFAVKDMAGVIGYFVAGVFVFGMLVPEALNSNFLLGNMPFPTDKNGVITADQNEYIPKEYFQQGIIDWGNKKGQAKETTLLDIPDVDELIQGIIDQG